MPGLLRIDLLGSEPLIAALLIVTGLYVATISSSRCLLVIKPLAITLGVLDILIVIARRSA